MNVLAILMSDLTKATGSMFEQESLRMIHMATAIHPGAVNGGRSGNPRSVMENRVVMDLRAVTGDKSLFRQWHQKFVAAIGQVRRECEGIVLSLVREIDLGKDLDKRTRSS